MKRRPLPYPCIGYCIIDRRGYCVGCGRPPTLGMPEACVLTVAEASASLPALPGAARDLEVVKNGK